MSATRLLVSSPSLLSFARYLMARPRLRQQSFKVKAENLALAHEKRATPPETSADVGGEERSDASLANEYLEAALSANDVSQGQDGTATDADAEAVAPVEALPTASDKTDANLESEAHAICRALHVFIGSTAADMHDVR